MDIMYFWFIIGIILIGLEVFLGFTIILLFSGMAAFILGNLIFFNKIDPTNIWGQISIFFTITMMLSAILWKPLKRGVFSRKPKAELFNNIIGQEAVVIEKPLKKNEEGIIKWSGTFIKARLLSSEKIEELEVGQIVTIVEVIGNVFIVKGKD
jgi:membrane protein implicated in regulation of membrane protease activity